MAAPVEHSHTWSLLKPHCREGHPTCTWRSCRVHGCGYVDDGQGHAMESKTPPEREGK